MNRALEDAQGQKKVLHKVLREIELKLQGLQIDKETYSQIETIELKKKACQKLLHVYNMQDHQEVAQKLRVQRAELLNQREFLLQKREENMIQNNEQRDVVEELKAKIQKAESSIELLQKVRSDLVNRQIANQAHTMQSLETGQMQEEFEN